MRVHWSVAVILVIVAWGLAAQVLPTAAPGLAAWVYVVTGVAVAAVFLLSLLAHEISHAVVARRSGVPVKGITLWMLGGVAEMEREADTPGAELRIAGVGPLVSLLLGGVFVGLAAAVATAGGAKLLVAALAWLAGMNLLLGVFNVLPGAPLDGGRLLRAALWRWRGDRMWATSAAATAGRVLGAVLVGLGLADLFFGGNLGSLWLALVGWFIISAASAEERSARATHALAGLCVADVMTPAPVGVDPDVTVAEFIDQHLFAHQHSAFPVLEHGVPIGLVTLAGVRTVPREARSGTTVRAVAHPLSEIAVAAPDERVSDVLSRLGAGGQRALVLDRGTLVGILTPADITRAMEAGGRSSAVGRRRPDSPVR